MSQPDTQTFVQSLSVDPRLQTAVENHGIIEVANKEDYKANIDELEAEIKEFVEADLPDHDIDGKIDRRADSSSTCKSTACGGKSCH